MLGFIILFTFAMASKLQECIFEDCDIEKALTLDIVEPIDYALRYFLLKRFRNDVTTASLVLLGAPKDNEYSALIIGRSSSHNTMFQCTTTIRNALLKLASKNTVDKFFENKFNFRELIYLGHSNSRDDVKDVLVNVWGMDKAILIKFYYYIELRVILVGSVLKELEYISKRGEKHAHVLLGCAYLYGLGVRRYLDKALEHFWLGKSDNSSSAFTGIGRVMMEEEHRDTENAINAFKLALEYGSDSDANYCLYLLTDKSSDPEFEFDQYGYLKSAAYAGYLPAVYKYAIFYADQKFYDASNHSLMSVTQYHSGFLMLDDMAIEAYKSRNFKKALMIYLFLLEFNLPTALENCVYILEKHGCIENQDSLLFSIYDLLSRTNTEYHLNVGNCYYYGKGTKQSYTKAISSYLASRKTSQESAYNLAYMYENGLGVPKNLHQAFSTVRRYIHDDKTYLVRFYTLSRVYIKMVAQEHYIIVMGICTTLFLIVPTVYLFKK